MGVLLTALSCFTLIETEAEAKLPRAFPSHILSRDTRVILAPSYSHRPLRIHGIVETSMGLGGLLASAANNAWTAGNAKKALASGIQKIDTFSLYSKIYEQAANYLRASSYLTVTGSLEEPLFHGEDVNFDSVNISGPPGINLLAILSVEHIGILQSGGRCDVSLAISVRLWDILSRKELWTQTFSLNPEGRSTYYGVPSAVYVGLSSMPTPDDIAGRFDEWLERRTLTAARLLMKKLEDQIGEELGVFRPFRTHVKWSRPLPKDRKKHPLKGAAPLEGDPYDCYVIADLRTKPAVFRVPNIPLLRLDHRGDLVPSGFWLHSEVGGGFTGGGTANFICINVPSGTYYFHSAGLNGYFEPLLNGPFVLDLKPSTVNYVGHLIFEENVMESQSHPEEAVEFLEACYPEIKQRLIENRPGPASPKDFRDALMY